VASWSEVKLEDLLSDGETNSREQEQGVDEDDTEPAADTRALIAAVQAATPTKPPFRMEIVEAQDVREVLFDADTGKPIRPVDELGGAGGPMVTPSPSPGTTGSGNVQAPTVKDADKMLEEFPIEFDAQN
jgi:hypothetical protein